jgi:hypothetical protein
LNHEPDGLQHYLAADADRPVPPALGALTTALQARFGASLAAVLFYGSCLRTGEIHHGVVDLHVIIDDYRAYRSSLLAALNRLLAPNVFYLRSGHGDQALRAKYNVFGLAHLERLVAPGRIAVFAWARLAQRSAVLYARDAQTCARIHELRARAVRTFAQAAAPLIDPAGDPTTFWRQALQLTFGCELRAESPERAAQVVAQDQDYFAAVTRWLPQRAAAPGRLAARAGWALRKLVGKLGSVLRLIRGWYTFDGGLDYLVWKLERHSGHRIEVPERVRRRPGLHIWAFAWRLYRDGVFR